jgi:pimeloyl-ACP methyl ester carboxylesterase
MAVETRTVTTRRGIEAKVHTRGDGPPLVWFHGAGGLFPVEPMLDLVAEQHTIHAAEWPGFGDEQTEGYLEDMLDFTLHGWDLVDAMGLGATPDLAGHSMGGMIAAEMAAVNPGGIGSLVLIAAAGLWIDEHPVPDIFSMLPFELAQVLFADPVAGEAILTAGLDFNDDEALTNFLVLNSRRLGTAGKILFPIPNRRLSKRLYRITSPTLLLWGEQDHLVPPVYAERFRELLVSTAAYVETVGGAGHMLPYEQPEPAARAIVAFLSK